MRALIAIAAIAAAATPADGKPHVRTRPRAPRLAADPSDAAFARWTGADARGLAYPDGPLRTIAGDQEIAIAKLRQTTVGVLDDTRDPLIVNATGTGVRVVGAIARADLRDTTVRTVGLVRVGAEPHPDQPGVFVRPGLRGQRDGDRVTLRGAIRATGTIPADAIGKVFLPDAPPTLGDTWTEMPLYDAAAPHAEVPLRAGADPRAATIGALVEAVGRARVIATDGGDRTLEVVVDDGDAWAHGFVTLPAPRDDGGEEDGVGGFGLAGRGEGSADDVAVGACVYLAPGGALVGVVTGARAANAFRADGWGPLAFDASDPPLVLWVHRDRAGAFDRCTPRAPG